MKRRVINALLLGTSLALGATSLSAAEMCPGVPTLGRKVAVTSHIAGSLDHNTSLGSSVMTPLGGSGYLIGTYDVTRLDDVDSQVAAGAVRAMLGFDVAGFGVCPSFGVGFGRLASELPNASGRVWTTEVPVGIMAGKRVVLPAGTGVAPFVEPLLVRSYSSWESLDSSGWRIAGRDAAWQQVVWLGLTLDYLNHHLIARYKPATGLDSDTFTVGFGFHFGGRRGQQGSVE